MFEYLFLGQSQLLGFSIKQLLSFQQSFACYTEGGQEVNLGKHQKKIVVVV